MATTTEPTPVERLLAQELTSRHAFGPLLFLGELAGFVRDRCPDPADGLPRVELRLGDGETVDVCHVVGVTPRWVAIAAREPANRGQMQTVLVPYEAIVRITIRAVSASEHAVGFDQPHAPRIVDERASAEKILTAARTGRELV